MPAIILSVREASKIGLAGFDLSKRLRYKYEVWLRRAARRGRAADGRTQVQLRKVPPLQRRWATRVAGREPRQGHRNGTALFEDDPLGGDVG